MVTPIRKNTLNSTNLKDNFIYLPHTNVNFRVTNRFYKNTRNEPRGYENEPGFLPKNSRSEVLFSTKTSNFQSSNSD